MAIMLLLIMIRVLQAQVTCGDGHSCYKDANRNIVWVKKAGTNFRLSCENICSTASTTTDQYVCDDKQSMIYDINSFGSVAQGLGFNCVTGGCWEGKGTTGAIWVAREKTQDASCYFPEQSSEQLFDCKQALQAQNCFSEFFNIICPCKSSTTTTTTTTIAPAATAPAAGSRKFVSSNNPTQYIQISTETSWIENSGNLLQCQLKNDPQYIVMKQDKYNTIKNSKILLMKDSVFENVSPTCKFPVFKLLTNPTPEILTSGDVKIYVSTDVSMTDYIDDIDIDLKDLQMTFLDPNYITLTLEDIADTQKQTPYQPMKDMTFSETFIEENEYTIECTADCEEFDANEFEYWLQYDYDKKLQDNKNDQSVIPAMIAQQFGGGAAGRRRRLGFWRWVARKVVRPAIRVIKKKVIQPVAKVIQVIIQIVRGNVDQTKEFGISIEKQKSNTFTSKYKYKNPKVKVLVEGNLDIEYGLKFDLLLSANLKAKWTWTPAKFEQLRLTISGKTEFLAWIEAQISASVNIEMLLFKKIKYYRFSVYGVPVVITLEGSLKMKLETEMEAKFMQQLGYEPLSVEFGIEYANGNWNPISNMNLKFELINSKEFTWGGDIPAENDVKCPLDMAIDLFLIPRFTVTLYKLSYAAVEQVFTLTNSYDVGASCIDGKEVCDIMADTTNQNKLGLAIGLDIAGNTNVYLGAKINIFGINIPKKEWKFPIDLLTFEKKLGETCVSLPTAIDYIFKNGICQCDNIATTNKFAKKICVSGMAKWIRPDTPGIGQTNTADADGTYEFAGIRNNAPYYTHTSNSNIKIQLKKLPPVESHQWPLPSNYWSITDEIYWKDVQREFLSCYDAVQPVSPELCKNLKSEIFWVTSQPPATVKSC